MDAKILIVDDEPAIRRLVTRYLADAGYECQLAESVASAKKILAIADIWKNPLGIKM